MQMKDNAFKISCNTYRMLDILFCCISCVIDEINIEMFNKYIIGKTSEICGIATCFIQVYIIVNSRETQS